MSVEKKRLFIFLSHTCCASDHVSFNKIIKTGPKLLFYHEMAKIFSFRIYSKCSLRRQRTGIRFKKHQIDVPSNKLLWSSLGSDKQTIIPVGVSVSL